MLDGYDSSDYVNSEEMEDILKMSQYECYKDPSIAEPPKERNGSQTHLRKHDTNARLDALESEIQGIDEQIEDLKALRKSLIREKEGIVRRDKSTSGARSDGSSTIITKGKAKAATTIDYTTQFDWDFQLKKTMREVFGILGFRLCQQGVCNANMDGRDVICVMPTGGGKSLTYQLPALLTPGCTLVISPLISLITDQVLHLEEAGVDAVMLTKGAPVADIQRRLTMMASLRVEAQQKEIKLCYVTPEKIAKNRNFKSILQKLVESGKLARIVIDEAHCVSQLGHDFRPDYKKLGVLRQFFPNVPILALSATCPPRVLQDILKILHMNPVVDGKAAPREGTVYFSSPLYRKNLHYTVLPKPSSTKEMFRVMSDYILKNHKYESGIIYCLSKKDAEIVAAGLREESKGQIRTGVYHAGVPDTHREDLHKRWREGSVQVVCATIAFGLGIDKGNVRFVLHHTISKSLDGYYQESGRAGRDNKDADCVLYYRPQDAVRQSTITYSDIDGQTKLHDMLRFAQDMQECRKIIFAKYFSASSDLSVTSWATEESGAMDRCGHCDNCTRSTDTVVHKDVTLEAWQTLKILQAVDATGGRQTIAGLSDLARGGAGGSYESTGKGKKTKDKLQLDYDAAAGGKVVLLKEDLEILIVHLLVSRYLKEEFSPTSYSVNVYIRPGELALRLTRYTREEILGGKGPRLHCSFRQRMGKPSLTAGKKRKLESNKTRTVAGPSRLPDMTPTKPECVYDSFVEASEEDEEIDELGDDMDDGAADVGIIRMPRVVDKGTTNVDTDSSEDDMGEDGGEWEYSLRPSSKKRKVSLPSKGPSRQGRKQDLDDEDVISLSSD